MAITNFVPTIWSARLMENLRNNLVYGQPGIINRDYEGEIREMGDTVKILSIGTVTISDYTKNTDMSSPQTLDDASSVLQIDRSRSFNFYLDDVDRVQARPGLMDATMSEAAFALANDTDKWLATYYAHAGVALGSDASPVQLGVGAGDKNAYEKLVDISIEMDKANIPANGRWVVVSPWVYGLLLKDNRFTNYGTAQNRATLANGEIGEAAGLRILRSNNVPTTSGDTRWKIIAGHSMVWTLAVQFQRIEAYRPEKRFGDAVKGLLLAGAKVARPSGLVTMTVSQGTL